MIHSKILFLICKYNCLCWVSVLCTNIILPPPPTPHLENPSVTGWYWHLHQSQLKRSGNPWIITENMAATSSLSSELPAAIQVPNLRPMPVYLSESDSLTVAEFLQTHYAAYYKINVSNVYWGGEINASHLFDIYCNFHLHKDCENSDRRDFLCDH